MRWIVMILFLIVGFGALGQSLASGNPRINFDSLYNARDIAAIGRVFPAFEVTNESETINNSILKGKVVLINFWFEGCQPCRAEMGALNELHQQLKDNKDFEFMSFTWDNAAAIKRVEEKFNLLFKVFHADEEECRRLNQNNGYPTTIVLDRNGKIAGIKSGGFVDSGIAREYVKGKLLGEVDSLLKSQ